MAGGQGDVGALVGQLLLSRQLSRYAGVLFDGGWLAGCLRLSLVLLGSGC